MLRVFVVYLQRAPGMSGYNVARYVCGSTAQRGCHEEGICATRIILNRTGKSTKLAVW